MEEIFSVIIFKDKDGSTMPILLKDLEKLNDILVIMKIKGFELILMEIIIPIKSKEFQNIYNPKNIELENFEKKYGHLFEDNQTKTEVVKQPSPFKLAMQVLKGTANKLYKTDKWTIIKAGKNEYKIPNGIWDKAKSWAQIKDIDKHDKKPRKR